MHQEMIRSGEDYLSRFNEGVKSLGIPLLHILYDGVSEHILIED
jgi:hypothetical protein